MRAPAMRSIPGVFAPRWRVAASPSRRTTCGALSTSTTVHMAHPRPEVSIVVPVYGSEKILPHLVEQVATSMQRADVAGRFELILVNDASPDDSWTVIRELAARFPFVRGVCLMRNFGQHNATMAGLNHARGEVVVIMDDDLQHPPQTILELV